MPDTPFDPGFQSVEDEYTREVLPVAGTIPDWLSGMLVRNGPGKFDVDGRHLRHWFDGLAMLRKYEFADGAVQYSNRFLRTESYAAALEGRVTGQFGTDERGLSKLRGLLARLGPPEPTDNANVHIARIDDTFVALTEVPRWVEFDPETLETRGEFVFRDLLDAHMITAHLVEDPHRTEHVGHALQFGRTHEYRLFRLPHGTRRREQIASLPTEKPAYVHSIGVSESSVVLVETPLRIDVKRTLSPFTEGFFDLLVWDDDRNTRFVVVDRDTGSVVRDTTTDPFFTFHVVNAYDDGDAVVVDLVEYEDDGIIEAMTMTALEKGGFAEVPPGRLVRYRIPGVGDGSHHRKRHHPGGVTRQQLYVGGIELPTVRREVVTRPHRYVYGQATDREGANGLVRVDTRTGTAREWWEPGLYVEEPIPVWRPDDDPGTESAEEGQSNLKPENTAESEGVVLVTALDADAERSVLLVFDAATLTERARAPLPQHDPFGFHGRFFFT